MIDEGLRGIMDEFGNADPNKSVADKEIEKNVQSDVEKVVADTKEEPKPDETKKEEAPQVLNWELLNTIVGGDNKISSETDLKTFLEELNGRASKSGDLEKQLNDLQSKLSEQQALIEYIEGNEGSFDPKNTLFNGDEQLMKRTLITRALVAQGYNENVVSRALDPNLENMDALDVIAIGRQLKSKRLTGKEQVIKENALREIGVDLEEGYEEAVRNLSPAQRAQLDMQADEIVNEIQNVLTNTTVPEVADPVKKILEAKKARSDKAEQLKSEWESEKVTTSLTDQLQNIDLSYGETDFKYNLSEQDQQALLKEIALDSTLRGNDANKENIDAAVQRAKERFIGRNASKILAAAYQQASLKAKEDIEKKTYNGTQTDITREPDQTSKTNPLADAIDKMFSGRDVKNL